MGYDDEAPDGKVIVMNRPSPSLKQELSPADLLDSPRQERLADRVGERIGREKMPPPEAEDGAEGGPEDFDPLSGDYKAYGWAGKVSLPSLLLILKDGTECGINYADLASAYPGGSLFLPSSPGCKGNVIRLRIAGDGGVFMVIIEGVRLRRLWSLIMTHRTPWIHELPAGMEFTGSAEPVIWSISFQPPVRVAADAR
jgi:hypothetical protein